jgi:conjugal transfer pilin signal peptidase TrbI
MSLAARQAARAPRLPLALAFLVRAVLSLLLVLAVGGYVAARFRLGYDDQAHQCLPPYRWFLIDRADRTPRRGTLIAFAARGRQMGPYFRDGQIIVKRVAGIAGDRVEVGPEHVRVNDLPVGDGLALARTLKRPPSAFLREEPVPAGHLWVMGATADSFDSRYWGFLAEGQVIGRAYAIW